VGERKGVTVIELWGGRLAGGEEGEEGRTKECEIGERGVKRGGGGGGRENGWDRGTEGAKRLLRGEERWGKLSSERGGGGRGVSEASRPQETVRARLGNAKTSTP